MSFTLFTHLLIHSLTHSFAQSLTYRFINPIYQFAYSLCLALFLSFFSRNSQTVSQLTASDIPVCSEAELQQQCSSNGYLSSLLLMVIASTSPSASDNHTYKQSLLQVHNDHRKLTQQMYMYTVMRMLTFPKLLCLCDHCSSLNTRRPYSLNCNLLLSAQIC